MLVVWGSARQWGTKIFCHVGQLPKPTAHAQAPAMQHVLAPVLVGGDTSIAPGGPVACLRLGSVPVFSGMLVNSALKVMIKVQFSVWCTSEAYPVVERGGSSNKATRPFCFLPIGINVSRAHSPSERGGFTWYVQSTLKKHTTRLYWRYLWNSRVLPVLPITESEWRSSERAREISVFVSEGFFLREERGSHQRFNIHQLPRPYL